MSGRGRGSGNVGGRGHGGRGRSAGDGRGRGRGYQPVLRHQHDPARQRQPYQSAPPPTRAENVPSSSTSTASLYSLVENLSLGRSEANLPLPQASTKALRPVLRPGYGTVGKRISVMANHFVVSLTEDINICHYNVSIFPEVTSKRLCRDIINKLVALYKTSHLGNRLPAYDGRKNIYTNELLPFQSKEFAVKLEDGDRNAKRKDREYKVSICFAAKLDHHYLQNFLRGQQLDCPYEVIQCLDVVLRSLVSTMHVCVGRSFFSSTFGQPKPLGNGVEAWKGYYQSLRPSQLGLSFNVDLSATSFFEPLIVTDFIHSYLSLKYSNRPMQEADRLKLKKVLRGVKVEATHRPGVRRQYQISTITSQPTNNLMFEGPDGIQISVGKYFQEKYKCHLQYDRWPCLQCGSESKPTYLPLEICKIVPGQRYTKKLNDKQVREMLSLTARRPEERLTDINRMVVENNYVRNEFAQEFGIHVVDKPTVVAARLLPPPSLKYLSKNDNLQVCSPRGGSWNMIDKKMANGGMVNYWGVLNFSNCHDKAVHNFCYELTGTCQRLGMKFTSGPGVFSRSSLGNIDNSLRGFLKGGISVQLLIIILPDRPGYYGKIKKICETELDVVSQCCQPKNVLRFNPQYLENVALKINVKCGGRNTEIVDKRNLPVVCERVTIIFGADVTHPQPGEDSGPSIAAVVASVDWPEVTKYRCLISAQKHRDEIISDLYTSHARDGIVSPGGMIMDHLRAFYKLNRRKPDNIIFYRDGVSEGQFNAVLLHEMDAIRKACSSLQADYLPRVTFVVVQKRHHTKLFPTGSQNADRSGNIVAGTVVDNQICHPTEFDFFLCSHAGIKGTSRPTHYRVLYDENGFTADAIQTLTNNLCYTYARCTRSVSVVPPVYYAHLAAFRARYYLEDSSESGSAADSRYSNRGREAEVNLPKIKDNVMNVMFYC